MGEQKKSIGHVLYETMYHGHYPAVNPAEQARWEVIAQTVKAAVLAEQAAHPTCPACGQPGRSVCGPCLEAAIRQRNLPDDTPGQRAYEMWQRFTWDNQKNPTLQWRQLTTRDHANWEVIADPDGTVGAQAEPQGAGGLAQQEERVRAAIRDMVAGHSVARSMENAILAGLKAWEDERHG